MTPTTSTAGATERAERQPIPLPDGPDNPSCPKCGGRMWDNRLSKRNPKAPDFKCRNRACDGVLWPGQHRATFPATRAPQLAVMGPDSTPSEPTDSTSEMRRPLREKYLDITDFVLQSVRPKYEEVGLTCGPETVAAIAATLYIAETRREGL